MSTIEVTIAVVVVALVIVLVAGGWLLWRHQRLKDRFGPEYERAVAEHDSRIAAERDLAARERRHAKLELRPLDEPTRARYAAAWQKVQAEFVESPQAAIGDAEQLMNQLIAERGYPTDDPDVRIEQLSVDHARTLNAYREAHGIYERHRRGEAGTEDLRQALVHYRLLFTDLLDSSGGDRDAGHDGRGGGARHRAHNRVRR